jgi:hypothetical protein
VRSHSCYRHTTSRRTVLSPSGQGEITDFPIFVYKKGKKRDAPGDGASSATWQYLHQDTLKNYFKEYFNGYSNVACADKHPSDSFKPHSCRNAEASLLHSNDVGALCFHRCPHANYS